MTRAFANVEAQGGLRSLNELLAALNWRKSQYDVEFVLLVVGLMGSFESAPPDCLRDYFCDNTSLVPEEWQQPQTIVELMLKMRRLTPVATTNSKPTPSIWPSGWGRFTAPEREDAFLSAFPPRTKGDLAIRNCRFEDVFGLYQDMDILDQLEQRTIHLHGFDYITACNILLASALMPASADWWGMWALAGAFDGNADHYREVTKLASDHFKKWRVDLDRDTKTLFYENHCLGGALLPPVAGFDPASQTRELAASGQNPHGLTPWAGSDMATFEHMLAGLKCDPHDDVQFRTFDDFVRDYSHWERAGASSVGRVHWHAKWPGGSGSGRFKARKNLVVDIMTPTEILAYVDEYGERQDNVAIIKSELAKIRIAVASPMAIYLQQSWIMDLAGRFYLRWDGNTMEETPMQELVRSHRTWVELNEHNAWSLPFDYKAFDHQPRTEEVLAMERLYHSIARTNVPSPHLSEFDAISRRVLLGYTRATLREPTVDDSGSAVVHPVRGGVMSGLRATTYFNNAFNLAVGRWATDVVEKCLPGRRNTAQIRECRGDDTKILDCNYLRVLATRIGYEAVGGEGNDSKFGIFRGRTEFLRIEMSDRARAYLGRTLPNLLQRKPWNPSPWMNEGRLSNMAVNLWTCVRRGVNVEAAEIFLRGVVKRWARKARVPVGLYSVPVSAGGLGILPWDGKFLPAAGASAPRSHPSDALPGLEIVFEGATTVREAAWKVKASQYAMEITDEQAQQLAAQDRVSKLATDDIPDLIPVVKEVHRKQLRAVRLRSSAVDAARLGPELLGECLDILHELRKVQAEPQEMESIMQWLGAAGADFPLGAYSANANAITDMLRIARVRGEPASTVLRRFPDFYDWVRKVEKQLKLKRHMAIDWALGTLSSTASGRAHPQMVRIVTLAVAAIVVRCRFLFASCDDATFAIEWAAERAHDALCYSPLVARYFNL